MPDEPVAEERPGFARNELKQVLFDFFRSFGVGESEALGEALDVGVDNDAFGAAKDFAEDDVGGFSADAWELNEGVEGVGDGAVVVFKEGAGAALNVASFGAEEAGGLDEGFEFREGDFSVVAGGFASGEKGGGDLIDSGVGALGGEDGGDEEIEGGMIVEFAVGVGVGEGEALEEGRPRGGFFGASGTRGGHGLERGGGVEGGWQKSGLNGRPLGVILDTDMEMTRTAFGTWNGGRFMHFGEPLDEERFVQLIQLAYGRGIRTFMTADVYGNGAADELLGKALKGLPRESYVLVGMIGHDFYKGERAGSKGYPRFTEPSLRGTSDYADYIEMATEKSLERCKVDRFDCLMLHNPDFTGYRSEAVWKGMQRMKDQRLAGCLGVAPGPANGFTLDLLLNFERFEGVVEWSMVILNPLEPWPGRMCLGAAQKHGVKLITRVVDHGGLFHGDVKPGHEFAKYDHRTYRPAGWVEAGNVKIEKMLPIAERHGLSLLHLACLWNLSQVPVKSVIPTLIQEIGLSRSIEEKVVDLANLPELTLSPEEVEEIAQIGENKGCMALKGGNPQHSGEALPDRWVLNAELLDVAERWGVEPSRDLVCTHS